MTGVKSWLLKDTVGIRFNDKLILISAKIGYLFLRMLLRGLVGKKRRDRIVIDAKLDFNTFLYNCFKILGLNNRLLLGVIVPPFGYRFFCRINREDYTFMTPHNGDIIKYFRPSKGDCVIDVGAHIGLYTIIGSKRVGSDGRVIAIEAYPENFELLKKNAKLNNLENTIVLNYAAYFIPREIKPIFA